jgi:signal transduction histidine kinase
MDRAAPFVAPAAVTLFVAVGLILTRQPLELALPAGVVAVATAVVLAARRATGWALFAGLSVVAAGVTVIGNAESANLGWFALCVVMGWSVFSAGAVPSGVLGAGLLLVYLGQLLQDPGELGWGAWTAGTVFTAVVCSLGVRQRELVDQLRQAQAGLADRARVEERTRIAAEMHDVIGHALTVSLMHVSAARLAIDGDPDEARAALAEAERLARRSASCVRRPAPLPRSPAAPTSPSWWSRSAGRARR